MLVLVISLISISNSELCNEILNDVLIKVQDLQKVVQDLIDIPKAGEIFKIGLFGDFLDDDYGFRRV